MTRCDMAGVQAVTADTAHTFGRHCHDQYGIGIILRGAHTSLSGRGRVEAMAGDIITVNPGEVHDGKPLDARGRTWQMLYFDPQTLAAPLLTLTAGRSACAELVLPTLRDPSARPVFWALLRSLTDPTGGDSEIEAQQQLLCLLARLIDTHGQTPPPSVPSTIARARARIDEDPAAALSLAELAELAGVSQFQLIRGFAKATGLTPHAYLVQRRLQYARRLIAHGSDLAEAAQRAGFADQSHLTRWFSRAYGMSPGRYAAGSH